METLGRADEDDPERVPADALAEGSAGTGSETYGGFLLRRRSRAAPGLRSTAKQVASVAGRCPHPHHANFRINFENKPPVRLAQRRCDFDGGAGPGKYESEEAVGLRQGRQQLSRLGR